MPSKPPILHLLCGKIAAGKSTLAAKLAAEDSAVMVAEDEWLSALYPGELSTGQDFLRRSGQLRQAVGPHVVQLLGLGVSVVLDFQGNTLGSRQWMRGLIEASGAAHQFHVLAPPDEVCLARLRARNASGAHPYQVTEAQFHQFSKHFEMPQADEGFNLVMRVS